MYTTIAIFYISFALIALMIILKKKEAVGGTPSLVSRLGRGSDHFFHKVFDTISTAISYINKHTFLALGHWVVFHLLLRVRKVYVEIKARFLATPQGKRMLDALRGRGEIKHHGASFYLRRISGK